MCILQTSCNTAWSQDRDFALTPKVKRLIRVMEIPRKFCFFALVAGQVARPAGYLSHFCGDFGLLEMVSILHRPPRLLWFHQSSSHAMSNTWPFSILILILSLSLRSLPPLLRGSLGLAGEWGVGKDWAWELREQVQERA